MNFDLIEEQKMVRQAVIDFLTKEVIPFVHSDEKSGRFQRDKIRKMGELGFLGCAIPERYGGNEMGFLTQVIIIEEVTRASIPLGYCFNQQAMSVPLTILNWGTEEQRQKYLPPMVRGEITGTFSLTEPDVGSDAASIKTRAVKKGEKYILNGSKMWASYASVAGVIVLFAKTDLEARHRGISCFAVEPENTPGLTIRDIDSWTGTNLVPSCEIILEDAKLPEENLIGKEGEGFTVAMHSIQFGRLTLVARCVGLAQASLDNMVKYCNEREAFGQKIGKFQMVQKLIADSRGQIEGARLLLYRAAWLADQGRAFNLECAVAKYMAAEACRNAADYAMEVYGAYGHADEYPIARTLLFSHVLYTGEGPANIQRVLIAEDTLGWKSANRAHIPPKFKLRGSKD